MSIYFVYSLPNIALLSSTYNHSKKKNVEELLAIFLFVNCDPSAFSIPFATSSM